MQTNRLPLSKFGGLGIFSLMAKAISLAPAQSEARERCETGAKATGAYAVAPRIRTLEWNVPHPYY